MFSLLLLLWLFKWGDSISPNHLRTMECVEPANTNQRKKQFSYFMVTSACTSLFPWSRITIRELHMHSIYYTRMCKLVHTIDKRKCRINSIWLKRTGQNAFCLLCVCSFGFYEWKNNYLVVRIVKWYHNLHFVAIRQLLCAANGNLFGFFPASFVYFLPVLYIFFFWRNQFCMFEYVIILHTE